MPRPAAKQPRAAQAPAPGACLRTWLLAAACALCVALCCGCSLIDLGPLVLGGDVPGSRVSSDSPPLYEGEPYTEVNDNVPGFSMYDATLRSFEVYSGFDLLGRCGAAFLCVGPDLLPDAERESIGSVKPSGWHTVKYDFIDGKYLYNRCHLAAYMLSGENTNKLNLITGTRYLNVYGMAPFEQQVYDYVLATGNHVLYRVTPVFEGVNLVASGVQMEACSVEDGGAGVCFNVYVFNVQPGVKIDYLTGLSALAPDWEEQLEAAGIPRADVKTPEVDEKAEQEPQVEAEDAAIPQGTDYVLNTNTLKFHRLDCESAAALSAKNRAYFDGTRKEAIAAGYEPCGKCKP